MRLIAAIAIGMIAAFVVIFALRQPAPNAAPLPEGAKAAVSSEYDIEPNQVKTFGVLANYVGMTLVSDPDPDTGIFDTQVWDWALDGNVIRIRHVMSDGEYGGDTYVFPTATKNELAYHYITNMRFATVGKMTLNEDGSWTSLEDLSGRSNWTQVKSTGRRRADGAFFLIAEYTNDNGETWTPEHSFTYSVAPAGTTLPRLKPLP